MCEPSRERASPVGIVKQSLRPDESRLARFVVVDLDPLSASRRVRIGEDSSDKVLLGPVAVPGATAVFIRPAARVLVVSAVPMVAVMRAAGTVLRLVVVAAFAVVTRVVVPVSTRTTTFVTEHSKPSVSRRRRVRMGDNRQNRPTRTWRLEVMNHFSSPTYHFWASRHRCGLM